MKVLLELLALGPRPRERWSQCLCRYLALGEGAWDAVRGTQGLPSGLLPLPQLTATTTPLPGKAGQLCYVLNPHVLHIGPPNLQGTAQITPAFIQNLLLQNHKHVTL